MSLSPSDYSSLHSCIVSMEDAVREMETAKVAFGRAKAIVELASDHRKTILAQCSEPFLDECSSVAAETKARASGIYVELMTKYRLELSKAETTIAEYYITKARWETERSKASAERAMVGL